MTCWHAAAAAAVGSAAAVGAVVAHVLEAGAAAVGLDPAAVAGLDLVAVAAVVADTVVADTAAVEIWLAARRACRGSRRSKP